jgi:hypothetical protein
VLLWTINSFKGCTEAKGKLLFPLSKKSVIAIFDIRIKLPTFCVQQSLLLSISIITPQS